MTNTTVRSTTPQINPVLAFLAYVRDLSSYGYGVTCLIWIQPLMLAGTTFFRRLLCFVLILAWSGVWYASKQIVLQTFPGAFSKPVVTSASVITALSLVLCLVSGFTTRSVIAALVVSVAATAEGWINRWIGMLALPAVTLDPLKVSRRASLAIACAFVAIALVWLLPVFPWGSGPDIFETFVCFILVVAWGLAARSNYLVNGYKIQLGWKRTRTFDGSTLSSAKLDENFQMGWITMLAGEITGLVIFHVSWLEKSPHWKTIGFSLFVTFIIVVVAFTKSLLAAKAVELTYGPSSIWPGGSTPMH